MRITSRMVSSLGVLALAITLAACSGSSGGPGTAGSGSTGAHGPVHQGGTATIALVAAAPNFIFPLAPATNQDGWNINLTMGLWPYLVYSGDGAKSTVNPQESLFTHITYSDGDKVVTIGLKDWNWSDGKPITSRDFTFVYNLLKANVPNWNYYVPGLFPDRRGQGVHAQRTHRGARPDPLLQPDLLHRRRAHHDPAAAPARLGQDLRQRPGEELRRDHRRGQGRVQLPAKGRRPDEHVHHQPAVEGRGRAVDPVGLPERRLLQLRSQHALLGPGQAAPVQGHLDAVHHRHRGTERAAVGQHPGRGPAPPQRHQPDRGAQGRGVLGGQPAHPRRGRDLPEPLQRQRWSAAPPALHPAGTRIPDRPPPDRRQGLRRLRRPGQRPDTDQGRRTVGLAAGAVGRAVPVLAVEGDRAAEGARLEGGPRWHVHLPAPGHRGGRLRRRHHRR